jgi:hypothetical protein
MPIARQGRADADAVIVGSGTGSDQREDVLRQLARTATPMLLAQPPCSAILAFELDMIQRDTGAPMIPLCMAATHPAVCIVTDWMRAAESPIGHIEQISLERTLAVSDNDSIRAALAQDGLLLRTLVGDFQQVSALQGHGDKQSLSNLSVQLTGDYPAMTRWSLGPMIGEPTGELTLVGNLGRATLAMPSDGEWTLSRSGVPISLPSYDPERALIQRLEDLSTTPTPFPTWEDACRAMDFADMAAESVRRGKTLSVHNQRLTEEDTFKSMMAAGGCLILMLVPLVLLAVSLVEGLRIPFERTATLHLRKGESSIRLPTDVRRVNSTRVVDGQPDNLRLTTPDQLVDQFRAAPAGQPRAFAVGDDELMLAPAPDRHYEILIAYDGTFTLWRRWPLLVLLPIGLFLTMQLLKLAFPRRDRPRI